VSFAHPLIALAAGLSVALPILIHLLLRFRRRPVRWGAMRFLYEAYRRQRKRLRLQQILLLATRCLILLLAGLAIARPLAGGSGAASGPRDVYLVIDNSLASQLRAGEDGASALEGNLELAARVIRGLGPGDRVAVVTAAAPASGFVTPPTADHGAAASALESIEATEAGCDLEGALRAVRDALEADASGQPARVVVCSELRAGSLGERSPSGAVFEGRLVTASLPGLAETPAENVQVTGVDPQRTLFLGADERTTVRVSLRRFGAAVDRAGTTTVRVTHEPAAGAWETASAGTVDAGRATGRWSAGQRELDVFVSAVIPPASGQRGSGGTLRASIDRDRLAGDDARRAPLSVEESVRVGVVDRAGLESGASGGPVSGARWVELALAPERSSRLEVVGLDPSDVDVSSLSGLDVVFVLRPDALDGGAWDLLGSFVRRGGTVALFPPPGTDAHPWAALAAPALGTAARFGAETREHDPALRVELPARESGVLLRMLSGELEELVAPVRVLSSLAIEAPAGESETLLRLSDGTPWAVRAGAGGAGEVVLFGSAVSLEWSTLPATPLMVPLMQEIVRQGAGASLRGRVYTAGRPARLPEGAASIERAGGERLVAVESGSLARPVRRAGAHALVGSRGERMGPVCFVADVGAGDPTPTPREAAAAWFREAGLEVRGEEAAATAAGSAAGARGAGLGVSGALFIAALALAALETYLARRFSPRGEPGGFEEGSAGGGGL